MTVGRAQWLSMCCQWKGRACQAELPEAAFQSPLNSNCSNVEWYISDLQVCQTGLCYKNTVCNFLISLGLVMPHTPRIQFQVFSVSHYNTSLWIFFATSVVGGLQWNLVNVCQCSKWEEQTSLKMPCGAFCDNFKFSVSQQKTQCVYP